MTSRPLRQCAVCRHLELVPTRTCTAYPDGIPENIWENRADHRQPQPGDHGVRWTSMGGAEFPEWAMAGNLPTG